MRKIMVVTLLFLAAGSALAQPVPAGWKTIKDAKGACQISVPENWTPGSENSGSAFFQDASVGIAVVTSQPGQTLKPIAESMLRLQQVPKEKVFENTAKRVFYQDRTSADAAEPNALSAMAPGKNGTCSSRVVYLTAVPDETARKIALSVAPAAEPGAGTK